MVRGGGALRQGRGGRPPARQRRGLRREDGNAAAGRVRVPVRPQIVPALRRRGQLADVVRGGAVRRGGLAPQQLALGQEPPLRTLPAVRCHAYEVGPARLGRRAGVGPARRQGYNRASSSEPSLSLSYALRTEEKGAAGRSVYACGMYATHAAAGDVPFRT